MSKSYKIRNYDYVLLFMTIGIAVFGVFMIYSAGYYTAVLTGSQWRYVTQQVLGLGIGVVGMILVSGIDYRLFIKPIFGKKINFVYLVYLAAIIMQVAVLFVGVEKNGAKRWLNLGFVQFQPSEISKIAAILFVAYAIYRSRQSLDHFAGFLRVMLFMGPSIVLILVENMSSAIIVSGIVVGMCFVGSRKKLYFAVCLVLLICGGACYIFLGEGFRAERIDIWLHVETNENAHQIKQGLYAIATGGVFGKGLGNSMHRFFGNVLEDHVDCDQGNGSVWNNDLCRSIDPIGNTGCDQCGCSDQFDSVDRDSIAVDQLWWNFCDDHDGGNGTGVVGVSRK